VFRLGPEDDRNCLACQGQRIELPATPDPTRPRSLWLLATSVGGATQGRFTTERGSYPLAVGSWIGFLAERERLPRWGGLVPGRNGRLVRDHLAWLATHRHHAHGSTVADEPYAFCYLYRYRIDLDAETRFLRLPEEPGIRLFAMTLSEHAPWALPLTTLYGD
jgi:alpha-mannosidase